MKALRLLHSLAAAMLFSSVALASAPPSTSTQSGLSVDRTRLYFCDQADGSWVRGASYKARFSPEGMRYIPDFGFDAPCSFPVDVTLREATLGTEALPLSAVASVSRHGNQFLLDRGPVDIVVEVGVGQIEQTFVVDAAGESRDLCLVLDVQTDLAGTLENGELRWASELGSVHYSEAFVLDGAGRRETLVTEFDGTAITLTVPASFLAVAEGEIVIDPVIRTFSVSALQGSQHDVDVTYDLTTNQFLYIFEDQFSATDMDVLAIALDADTGVSVASEYFELGGEHYSDPSAASKNADDISLCVATWNDPNFGTPYVVQGRIWDHHQGTFGPTFIASILSYSGFADVGGSSSETPGGAFCMAWTRAGFSTGEVLYKMYMGTGTVMSVGSLSEPSTWPGGTAAISESSGSVDQWQVVWPERGWGFQGVRLRAAVIRGNGTILHGPATLKSFPANELIRDVHVSEAIQIGAFADPTYAVVYDLDSSGNEDTIVSLVRGTDVVSEFELQSLEHAGTRPDQSEARIATTANRFVVAYLESLPSNAYRAVVTSLGVVEDSSLAIAERRTDLGLVTPPGWPFHDGGALSMASKFSGGLYTSAHVGIGIDRATAGPSNVESVVFDDSSPESPARQYCYGNRNSTGFRSFIRMEGDNSASLAKTLRASGLPVGSFGYFLVGDGFANVVNPAGSAGVLCVGGGIGRYLQQIQPADAAGEISITFDPMAIKRPSGPVAGMPGDSWQFSLWHRDSSPTGTPTSNFANAISLVLR